MIVTTRHVFTVRGFNKRPGMCRDGARRWARAHGIDWGDFVRNGIDADKLEAIGDAFALAIVKWARECDARERATLEAAHG